MKQGSRSSDYRVSTNPFSRETSPRAGEESKRWGRRAPETHPHRSEILEGETFAVQSECAERIKERLKTDGTTSKRKKPEGLGGETSHTKIEKSLGVRVRAVAERGD